MSELGSSRPGASGSRRERDSPDSATQSLPLRAIALTSLALLAFAGNSILGRLALRETAIDPASFTAIRIASGALALGLLLRLRGDSLRAAGSWGSASALFVYAAAFSFAYVSLPAATGALLLFGAVQLTMIGAGLARGERLRVMQLAGLVLACGGVVGLLLPGLERPPWVGSALMLLAGIAWGVYSLRGRGGSDPMRTTAGCFLRATPLAFGLGAIALVTPSSVSFDGLGAVYAVASGAVTSGCGYAIWYSALRSLTATSAAVVQLAVPVLVSLLGAVVLTEAITPRLVLASAAILGGIAAAILGGRARR